MASRPVVRNSRRIRSSHIIDTLSWSGPSRCPVGLRAPRDEAMPGTHSVAACPGDGKRRLPCIRRLLDQLVDLDDRKQHGQYDHEGNAASNQDQNGLQQGGHCQGFTFRCLRQSLGGVLQPLRQFADGLATGHGVNERRRHLAGTQARGPTVRPRARHPGSHTPRPALVFNMLEPASRAWTGDTPQRLATGLGRNYAGYKADDSCTTGRPSLLETRLPAQA